MIVNPELCIHFNDILAHNHNSFILGKKRERAGDSNMAHDGNKGMNIVYNAYMYKPKPCMKHCFKDSISFYIVKHVC